LICEASLRLPSLQHVVAAFGFETQALKRRWMYHIHPQR